MPSSRSLWSLRQCLSTVVLIGLSSTVCLLTLARQACKTTVVKSLSVCGMAIQSWVHIQRRSMSQYPNFLLQDIDYEENFDFTTSLTSQTLTCQALSVAAAIVPTPFRRRWVRRLLPACHGCLCRRRWVLFDDWVDWVLRGHHGEKEENIQPFKWSGLGNYGGHTTLYSLAKKQDPNWTI